MYNVLAPSLYQFLFKPNIIFVRLEAGFQRDASSPPMGAYYFGGVFTAFEANIQMFI
jgi:hypothetical protein